MQELLHDVEQVAELYGLVLNKSKCCYIRMNHEQEVLFRDNTPVPTETDTIYLGANINTKARVNEEISRRIGQCVYTWKKLSVFWKNSTCPTAIKLHIYDAAVRAKLVYGLHTVRLLPSQMNRIDAFQRRGLRQILGVSSTFAQLLSGHNKTHTNAYLYQQANEAVAKTPKPGQKHFVPAKPIKPISMYIGHQALNLLSHVIRASKHDPMRRVTFRGVTIFPKLHERKRAGAPRQHWTLNTIEYAWDLLQDAYQKRYPDHDDDALFNELNPRHYEFLTLAAQSKGFGLT